MAMYTARVTNVDEKTDMHLPGLSILHLPLAGAMRRHGLSILVSMALCIACLSMITATVTEAQTADSDSILDSATRVADWQLANLPAISRTGWSHGVLYGGVMALDGVRPSGAYRKATRSMGVANRWQSGRRRYFADNHCISQPYLELYLLYRAPEMLATTKSRFDYILAHPSIGSLDITVAGAQDRWSWCDALYMAPPAWARLYRATGGTRFRDFLVKNWWRTSTYLYDSDKHMFYRDSRFLGQRESNGQKVFWARGNGWVIAGLVRVLQYLPQNDSARPRLVRQFKEMADAAVACQQPDGMWRASMLDPQSYPTPESSSTALFCYSFAWGINQRLLDASRFAPSVDAAWSALCSYVTPEGRLTHVQPPGISSGAFDPDHSEKYGTGAFLLAASEMYRRALAMERDTTNITFNNTTDRRRTGVLVRVPLADLAASLQGLLPESAEVMDAATSRFLKTQIEDDCLVFRVSVLPRESRRYLILGEPLRSPDHVTQPFRAGR